MSGASTPAPCRSRCSPNSSNLTAFAPSVGNCQPTRFVRVDDPARRRAIQDNFETANRAALSSYEGERARAYAGLKLADLREAPVQLAVFCDEQTELGHGLGVKTMPEMRRYSSVCALHTFWLAARARGVWASAGCRSWTPSRSRGFSTFPLPGRSSRISCVGWPQQAQRTPELERAGWQNRVRADSAAPVKLPHSGTTHLDIVVLGQTFLWVPDEGGRMDVSPGDCGENQTSHDDNCPKSKR